MEKIKSTGWDTVLKALQWGILTCMQLYASQEKLVEQHAEVSPQYSMVILTLCSGYVDMYTNYTFHMKSRYNNMQRCHKECTLYSMVILTLCSGHVDMYPIIHFTWKVSITTCRAVSKNSVLRLNHIVQQIWLLTHVHNICMLQW